MGELREIWLIRSNFPGFSVDGQRSETSELNMDQFTAEFAGYVSEFCLIRWNLREFSATGQASET